MNKLQLGLVIGGVVLIFLLFQMPRVVVENETLVDPEISSHSFSVPQEIKAKIREFRIKWESESETEKNFNFADSLANLYLDYQILDSAVWFIERLESGSSKEQDLRIGDLFFRAFQRARTTEEAKKLGDKSREMLEMLAGNYPENSSLKNKLAMTLVVTENPMAGIQMLRDILADDPENIETIKNLGILSIQSGQYDKAEERFRDLIALDSTDQEALFYLGMSQIELGNDRGYEIMKKLTRSDNPAIRSLAQDYIEN